MAHRYTSAGKSYDRPDSEYGIHVDGPLTVEDWKKILEDVAEVMVEKAREESQ